MQALISDIHGNLSALDAVFRDLRERRTDEILCLGDMVGYGPDPEACVDVVIANARLSLMGNHDYALLHGQKNFNPLAAESIRLTAERMGGRTTSCAVHCSHVARGACAACQALPHTPASRWQYLEHLTLSHQEEDILYVHGSPRDPVFEYVFPDCCDSAWQPDRVREIMKLVPRLAFCGHTHVPCVITEALQCWYPSDLAPRIQLDPQRKYIINLGSVGQPRDGDPRASYVLFDAHEQTVEWRRVPYDIAAVVARIEAMCGTGNWCGQRLWQGL